MAQQTVIVDFTLRNNETWESEFIFRFDADTLSDFTGCAARMELRTSKEAADVALLLTTESGRIVFNDPADDGVMRFNVPVDVMAALPLGTYVYDCVVIKAGNVWDVVMGGKVKHTQGVTRYDG